MAPPEPVGMEYFYWYDREGGNLVKSELLFIDGTLTTVTEELFPTLEDESHVFLGWYYYKNAYKDEKIYLNPGETFHAGNSYYNEFYGDWEKVPNKIIYNNETLIDISQDTVKSNVLIEGYTAHDKMGWAIEGTIPNNGTMNKTMDGINTKSITIPKGYTSGGTVSLDSSIDNAVSSALAALTEKGVTVPDGTKVDGLAALIAAIESGGGNISWGTFTLTSDTKDYVVTHDLGVVPDIFLFWMTNQKINGLTGNELFFGVNTSSSFKTLIGGSYSGASTIMTGNTTSSARYMTTLGSITSGGGSFMTLYGAPGSADATTIKLATSKESYFLCNGIIYVWVAIGGLS